MARRISKLLTIGACFLCVAGAAVWLILSNVPIGYFDSASLMGNHAPDDVLQFSCGVVQWKTCCGDDPAGVFSRASGGRWHWDFVYGKKQMVTNVFILRPGVFSLTCVDTNTPEQVWTLKRRLSPPRSIDAVVE